MKQHRINRIPAIALLVSLAVALEAQTTITINTQERHQVIDGFGAFQGGNVVNQQWWQDLYYGDLKASIYRVDLTPQLVSPYSDLNVYSPWFMGSSVTSVFNFEDPANPDGPEGNRVRTYTGPENYSRDFGGENAPIAVMGPDIEANINYFRYSQNDAVTEGLALKDSLGDFKLIGSIWSPLPWVKVSSGNQYGQNWWPGPVINTPWPFIWGGNYAGGTLDISDEPLDVFDDSAPGGDGPTSSLTQFARSTAAYVKGFLDFHGVDFYAISIQNELNFEQFYNSCTYPLSSQYIAALKAVRAEFDKHESLRDIQIMGPEDLLAGGDYGMWQYGGNNDPTHKNLQYLQNIANDPEADAALGFFCIHGYDSDGVSAGDANPVFWERWKSGWVDSPAEGIPADVAGYASYGKKSWMTETSGEESAWLAPSSGFPGNGAWSIGLRIHHALTVGDQSAWIYWTFMEDADDGNATNFSLTSSSLLENAPKYVAAKHFFEPIRPNSVRVGASSSDNNVIQAGAYFHEADQALAIVALNTTSSPQEIQLSLTEHSKENYTSATFLSDASAFWQLDSIGITQGISEEITMPAYSIISIVVDLGNASTSANYLTGGGLLSDIQIAPNPTSSASTLTFELTSASTTLVTLHDIRGKLLSTIDARYRSPGPHQLVLNTNSLANGPYLVQIRADGHVLTSRWLIQNR